MLILIACVCKVKVMTSKSNRSRNDETKSEIIQAKHVSDVKKSDSSSSRSSKKAKSNKVEINSDDIDVSQMELIANKKKLNKKPTDIDIELVKSKVESDSSSDKVKSDSSKSRKRSSYHRSKNNTSSSSSKSTKVDSDEARRKRISKENGNEYIRKEKSEYLYKFNKIHMKEKWSSLKLDMNCSLEEIKNEFDRVTNAIKVDRSVKFFKKMLLLGVQGVEMLNTKFDPIGVDLEGWSEAMSYNMDNQDYDEVMAELYEKYKSTGNMSPELKLIFMIISSAAFFTISKKLTKIDSPNGIMGFLGNFMNKGQQSPPMQPTQPMQPMQPMQSIPQQRPFIPPGMPPGMQRPMMQQSEMSVDDNTPSKLNNPEKLQDSISLNNIMERMNKRQQQKMNEEVVADNLSDEILKSIPSISSKKRGRVAKKRL